MGSLEIALDNRFAGFVEHLVPVNGNTAATVFDAILSSYRHMGDARAFLHSTAILKNINDSCIVCYEQWNRNTDFHTLTSTTLAPVEASLLAVAEIDLFMNDVIYSESRHNDQAALTFKDGAPFHIVVYSLRHSDDQQKLLVHIQRFMTKQFAVADELVAYTIHKSVSSDSVTNSNTLSRVAVLQQWINLKAANNKAKFWIQTDGDLGGLFTVDYSGIFETICVVDQPDH